MLPEHVKLEHLDDGVRELVVNLNRIPNVDTMTTCEGHLWFDIPAWPTKNGWAYIVVPEDGSRDDLIGRIKGFCDRRAHFNIEEHSRWDGFATYFIDGMFEDHQGEDNGGLSYEERSDIQQELYRRRAKKRKTQLLRVWRQLNDLVVDYIRENVSEDVESLPYR